MGRSLVIRVADGTKRTSCRKEMRPRLQVLYGTVHVLRGGGGDRVNKKEENSRSCCDKGSFLRRRS